MKKNGLRSYDSLVNLNMKLSKYPGKTARDCH